MVSFYHYEDGWGVMTMWCCFCALFMQDIKEELRRGIDRAVEGKGLRCF
jgi:hypothetical protein